MIGWSAGGILGREAARRNPDAVRQVITLGSPFRLLIDDRYRTHAAFFYKLAERWHAPPTDSIRTSAYNAPLLEVPATAIYSRTDGVASWQWCLEDDGPRAENIEVYGSHCGLGHNPAALVAIADRLAQPEGEWAPFTPPRAAPPLPRIALLAAWSGAAGAGDVDVAGEDPAGAACRRGPRASSRPPRT